MTKLYNLNVNKKIILRVLNFIYSGLCYNNDDNNNNNFALLAQLFDILC